MSPAFLGNVGLQEQLKRASVDAGCQDGFQEDRSRGKLPKKKYLSQKGGLTPEENLGKEDSP